MIPFLCFQTVIKEGMLTKQNNSFQRSKRRYFKLRGRTLYYAKTAKVRRMWETSGEYFQGLRGEVWALVPGWAEPPSLRGLFPVSFTPLPGCRFCLSQGTNVP